MDLIIVTFGILLGWLTFKVYFYWSDRKLLHSVTQSNRGNKSERDMVLKLLKIGFPKEAAYHDLYLSKGNGHYTQIDAVLATQVGLIVFEVKRYSGWLFGTGSQQKWTQVLAYGQQKYQFYNPILQNKGHIAALRNQSLQFQSLPIFSVVVFFGDCVFRDISYIPKNTYLIKAYRLEHVIDTILKENPTLEYPDKEGVIRTLKSAVKNGELISVRQKHGENIKEMIGDHRVFD